MNVRSFAAAALIAVASAAGIVSAGPANAGVTSCPEGYGLDTQGGVSACRWVGVWHHDHHNQNTSGNSGGNRH